ncbi:MAG: membrane protein insertase YidC [Planctomycetota bacterium]
MEKRLLLAIALTFLVTVFWMRYCVPKPQPKPPKKDTETSQFAEGQKTGEPESKDGGKETLEPGEEPTQPDPQPEPVQSVELKTFEIATPTLQLVLTNQGGGSLRAARLKQYYDQPGLTAAQKKEPEHWLPLLTSSSEGKGSLVFWDYNGDYGLDERLWEWDEPETSDDGSVSYRFKTSFDGIEVVKTILVPPADANGDVPVYDIRCRVAVTNRAYTGSRRTWNFALRGAAGLVEEIDDPFAASRIQTIAQIVGRDLYTSELVALPLDEDDLRKRNTEDNRLLGSALVGKYFTAALIAVDYDGEVLILNSPLGKEARVVEVKPEPSLGFPGKQKVANGITNVQFSVQLPEQGATREASFLFYVGPKDPGILEAAAYDPIYSLMEEDYGTYFGWITKALIGILHFFDSIVGNFGFAIILLTLLVRAILFPLNRKQQVTMQEYQKKMVVLKPKLEELREKYKNNRQKFSQEQMKLLKEHQATPPLAGCLPIFLQLPVFIGLFTALRVDIDLRHSPFILWIQDLSAPDKLVEGLDFSLLFFTMHDLNLLPILMTVTWIVNQSMMPKSEDPQQRATQKMMMIMPIIFAFMLYRYASGLSLYMFVGSLLGIFEQRVVKKTLDSRREKQLAQAAAAT